MGCFKATNLKPITIRGLTFEFFENNGVVNQLSVTVPANNPEDIPAVTHTPEARSKATIHVPWPAFLSVKKEIRAIEGALSLYGIDSIDVHSPKREWLPENQRDKEKLKIFNFKAEPGKLDISKLPNIPFNIVARAVISADKIAEIETQLAFFRKGIIDRNEERHIEAIYDFYFFLESMFAEGKTKNHRVKEAFKRSGELRQSIEEVFKKPHELISPLPEELKQFKTKYGGMSMDEIIKHIVDLRGFLHHHTPKRKDIWHPEEQQHYKLEANLLGGIAFSVAMRRFLGCIGRKEIIKIYTEMFKTGDEPNS